VRAFFQELFRAALYKRTQGRVTRQATFGAVVVVMAFGLYRLSLTMINVDPIVPRQPAQVTYAGNDGKAPDDATIRLTGIAPKPAMLTYTGKGGRAVDNATIVVRGGDRTTLGGSENDAGTDDEGGTLIRVAPGLSLERIARMVNRDTDQTGVTASVVGGDTLRFVSERAGAGAKVQVEVQSGTFEVQGDGDAGVASGADLGSATIAVSAGETLQQIAQAVNDQRATTGVFASVAEEGDTLTLTSRRSGADSIVRLEVLSGTFEAAGAGDEGTAHGRDSLNLGLRYCIPAVLLIGGLWATYRLVNVPACADFLIAVEAEMKKVSWPTQPELFRSSIVVLVTIFSLAFVLFGFDFFWKTIFSWLGIL
jgi:preprotein translocase SecE subunit